MSLDYSGNELYLLHGLTSTNDSIYYSGQGQTVSAGIGANGGNLSVNLGSQELSMSGNSTGTIGNAYYKDGTGEFTISGNTENKTGEVDLKSGSNEIRSTTTTDSSTLYMSMGNLGMEGLSSGDREMLKIQNGSDVLSVDADLQAQTGSLDIRQGNVRVQASGDKVNKTGSL